ncbi:hypothetical protein PAHAL_1G390300 [Panicum hallii]|uniref:Uncharacterized protein n=1 Tax=Panicum hallii TaxID=206008 RepID=A0A2S3GTE2_9POAL|nr:uncharacterized protein At3g17950-like [Panicum hallii]PAN08133.1 hypothetical protein PAHAL_1G390300 [Panicum hallii]
MDGDGDMIPSSPSVETSPSSSDVATESTGSFFRDRSTTLGTLMGVSLADDEPGQAQDHQPGRDAGDRTGTPRAPAHEEEGWRWRRRWRRRRWRSAGGGWWRLCRDDARAPTSLGHFLDMERQLTGAGLLCGDGAGERDAAAASPVSENDGRVRPLAAGGAAGEESGGWKLRRPAQSTSSSSLARLPVLLTAICSGGAA